MIKLQNWRSGMSKRKVLNAVIKCLGKGMFLGVNGRGIHRFAKGDRGETIQREPGEQIVNIHVVEERLLAVDFGNHSLGVIHRAIENVIFEIAHREHPRSHFAVHLPLRRVAGKDAIP